MLARERLPQTIVTLVIAATLLAFAVIQLASDALYAQSGSLSMLVPPSFGVRVYEALDRIAPAPYVEEALAERALRTGALDAAQRYAVRMPAGPRRDEFLGRIAEARGMTLLALEYYFVAPDVESMQREIMTLARTNAPDAYALELRFGQRLRELRTHPDAVAESEYTAGVLAEWLRWRTLSLAHFTRAATLAPLNMKYVLSAGNEAYVQDDLATARRYFQAAVDTIDPASGDALAGLGLVALRAGDRDAARAYLRRAQAADPHAQELPSLERALQ